MKKKTLFLVLAAGVILCFVPSFAGSENLRAGEAAIFLKSGDLVIAKITDISSSRFVLETESSGEFPLRDLWMINFVNDNWNFPEERDKIETNEHYIFLKDGGITSGKIIDFSSSQFVFEFENGEKIAIGRIRRIYFAKRVPDALARQQQGGSSENRFVGVYESAAGQQQGILNIQLTLNSDLTALMNVGARAGVQGNSVAGRWQVNNNNTITASFSSQTRRGIGQGVYTFRLEGSELVGDNQNSGIFANLRLYKR